MPTEAALTDVSRCFLLRRHAGAAEITAITRNTGTNVPPPSHGDFCLRRKQIIVWFLPQELRAESLPTIVG